MGALFVLGGLLVFIGAIYPAALSIIWIAKRVLGDTESYREFMDRF